MLGHEITLPAEGAAPATPAYAAVPANARRGMVVLHEIFGRQPEIDRVVERFARNGYAAVAPDLFAGALKPLCIARAVRSVASGEGPTVEQIRLARRWLATQANLDDKRIGVIGFCIGGGFALACASGFGAVSTNYGDVHLVADDLGPTIACFGGRDRIFRGNAEKLRKKLEARGIPHEIRTYPTVGHSFLTDGHRPIAQFFSRPLMHVRYDPQVAEEAWTHILAFFDAHLGGGEK